MATLRFAVLMLALTLPAGASWAQSGTGTRLDNAERRLNAIDPQAPGLTIAQATETQRLDAIERRLDALEQRMGSARQAQPQPLPPSAAIQAPGAAAPQASSPPTAAVQLPNGAVQQVPAATAAAAATPSAPAVSATYRSLGLHKGMTEAEVIRLLGPPVKIVRGFVDVLFYSKDDLEPNVNIQYGHVIGWHD